MCGIFPSYSHIVGYLHRWSICKLGKLHIRLHNIKTPDQTPFLHTHPFHYISIILRGGYEEQFNAETGLKTRVYSVGDVIYHTNTQAHRIVSVQPNTYTLFFAWDARECGEQGWELITHPDIVHSPDYHLFTDGVYSHGVGYRKHRHGKWYVLCNTPDAANSATKLSIRQYISSTVVKLISNE